MEIKETEYAAVLDDRGYDPNVDLSKIPEEVRKKIREKALQNLDEAD